MSNIMGPRYVVKNSTLLKQQEAYSWLSTRLVTFFNSMYQRHRKQLEEIKKHPKKRQIEKNDEYLEKLNQIKLQNSRFKAAGTF